MLSKHYEPQAIEEKIYSYWETSGLFKPEVHPDATEKFSMVIPPPNVTGVLHMGHALDNTIQDILTRYNRMLGKKALWMPGSDHAGIATQSVVERQLKAEGKTKHDLGREPFVEKVWDWAEQCKGNIMGQLRKLGSSPDWSRERFTLDEGCNQAVNKAFVHLYNKGLIYQGEYIVNWDPESQSAISDIETEYTDEESFLWEIAYGVKVDGNLTQDKIVVATTRPETMYGDVAVAVHPEDERYQNFIGQTAVMPLTGKEIPIIGDDYVEKDFGTGALKITPAHDPNDFEIGLRHNLTALKVLDKEAKILPLDFIPESIQGLERFEARKQTEILLEESGFLVGKKEHTHRVGRAQRSGAVIEPLLSKQWFVKTKPLAKQCLDALERGDIRFIPERWTKDYLRWMTNINDWCISRQLWWGHQIPAWHDELTGEIVVSETDPTQLPENANRKLVRDPDVLDTWFSSGLWPFSTMGWPNENAEDFKTFYPTDVLVTGFDIIFFWVARMTMFGQELTGKSPFHTVYIHGLIRDEKGQKMSKSKGNTVDPVDSIRQYGCDGFRFGLTSLITYGGQDIKLAPDKLEMGRLFSNKLWNAARFTLMNLTGDNIPMVDDQPVDTSQLTRMDQWILSRYHQTVAEGRELLDGYKFGEYAMLLYDFIWNAFCDWYVEYSKKQLRDEATQANTQRLLLELLSGILRLMHPIMPFLTEEIWQQLPHKTTDSISVAAFPQSDASLINKTLSGQVDFLLETVRSLRNIRQQYTVPNQTAITVFIESNDETEHNALHAGEAILKHFIKMDALTLTANLTDEPSHAATNVVGHSRIVVPLNDLIDVDQELGRLKNKMETLKEEQDQLFKMMGNHEFLERAPEAVVAKNKARLNEVNAQLKVLEDELTTLAKKYFACLI